MTTRVPRRMVLAVSAMIGCSDSGTTAPIDPGPLADLILSFCLSPKPAFLAISNGSGPWTAVAKNADGTYTAHTAEKAGLLTVFEDEELQGGYLTTVAYATRDELAAAVGLPCETTGPRTLSGSVSGLASSDLAIVAMGNDVEFAFPSLNTYTFANLPNTPVDLVAARRRFSGSVIAHSLIVRRDVASASGSTLSALNFDGTEAFAATTGTLTIVGGAQDDEVFMSQSYRTAGGTELELGTPFGTTSATLFAVPVAQSLPGDLHRIEVQASSEASNATRGVTLHYRDPGTRTATLGPHLPEPTISVSSVIPTYHLRATFASQPEYAGEASAVFLEFSEATEDLRAVIVSVSAAFVGGTPPTWDLRVPHFSFIDGFPSEARFQNTGPMFWAVTASDAITSLALAPRPADGSVVRFATRVINLDGVFGGFELRALAAPTNARARRTAVASLRAHIVAP